MVPLHPLLFLVPCRCLERGRLSASAADCVDALRFAQPASPTPEFTNALGSSAPSPLTHQQARGFFVLRSSRPIHHAHPQPQPAGP
ncbi:MAG: hypothetical protein ACK53L_23800, partial [Pirellulaceae bacterium]